MSEPLVYVLVLNYQSWPDTLRCLGALECLSYPNFRVLVLDNASPNDSVPRIQTAFPNIELIRLERNLGFAGGNNVGIRRALADGADYVWLLNPDTLADPQSLSAMVQLAQSDPQIGAVGSVLYQMNQPQQVQVWGGGEVVLHWGLIRLLSSPEQISRLSYLSGASVLLERTALERVGLLDEGFFMYGEDADLGLRLKKAGFKLAVASDSRVLHQGSTSWKGANLASDENFAAANVRLFRKHAPFPNLAAAAYCVFWTLEYSLRRRWASTGALWRGARRGWSLPIREEPWKF